MMSRLSASTTPDPQDSINLRKAHLDSAGAIPVVHASEPATGCTWRARAGCCNFKALGQVKHT